MAVLATLDQACHHSHPSPQQSRLISWAIRSAASRVPWRSDCLIQAMAASLWLDATAMHHQLRIGVRKSPAGDIEAHAWLLSGDTIVTGDLPDLDSFKIIPTAQAPLHPDAFR